MSVTKDSREVMQNSLAPDLRAISARMEAHAMDALEQRFNHETEPFDDVVQQAEHRQARLMPAIGRLAGYNEVRDRLTRLESKDAAHQ